MKLDSMIYPWPERPRTDVNMVIVECKCPKCKKNILEVYSKWVY